MPNNLIVCDQLAGMEVEQRAVHLVREGGEQNLPSYGYAHRAEGVFLDKYEFCT